MRVQRGKARQALDDIVIGRFGGIGAVGGKAVGTRIYQRGIDLAQVVIADLQPRGGGGAHRVHEHVGIADQIVQHRQRVGLFQVQRDDLLAAVHVQVDGAHPRFAMLADAPHAVPGRGLDLDHVGAKVGQDLRGIGTEDHRRQIHDLQPLEGSVRRRVRCHSMSFQSDPQSVVRSRTGHQGSSKPRAKTGRSPDGVGCNRTHTGARKAEGAAQPLPL